LSRKPADVEPLITCSEHQHCVIDQGVHQPATRTRYQCHDVKPIRDFYPRLAGKKGSYKPGRKFISKTCDKQVCVEKSVRKQVQEKGLQWLDQQIELNRVHLDMLLRVRQDFVVSHPA
jgi:hypothetical protein